MRKIQRKIRRVLKRRRNRIPRKTRKRRTLKRKRKMLKQRPQTRRRTNLMQKMIKLWRNMMIKWRIARIRNLNQKKMLLSLRMTKKKLRSEKYVLVQDCKNVCVFVSLISIIFFSRRRITKKRIRRTVIQK